ncbi:MAG: tRNA pseudouridine(55) synthase TruB [Mizugakiibacter sp.]|uniref:tRNA pseudouridine(55) synthase TruB n=1 Tax=Mizugakiibacter sp. TaxID=1972610 RepID=UPI0031CB0430|nr:tRNA pseudouridine(55) synthase TruB [Xanthomonadaceae bacterium]
MPRPPTRQVHGILLLDKPAGMSSNQALQAARRLYRADKAGHTGSLDPLATGLLPLCFGEATKIAGLLLGSRKAYAAECLLGVVTSTADSEGEVLERRAVPPFDDAALRSALATLRGRITQVPPVHSAIKQGGEPLYRRARRGEDVQAPPREVEVDRFECVGRDGPRLRLYVECGSGTYVRSLVRDLGERLGCGAHLTALRRLWVEPFRAPAMFTLDELRARQAQDGEAALDALLLPVDAGLAALPAVRLDVDGARALGHGRPVAVEAAPGRCRAHAPDGRLLALGEVDAAGTLRVVRGLNLPPVA